MSLRRLDAELTRRGLARSRDHAQELVAAGVVQVRGNVAHKCTTQVSDADSILILSGGPSWVSRGAHKLLGALDAWPTLRVAGRRALDVGASTGGFTQVLLERGAVGVIALDVGYGQLAWQLRTDPRVCVRDRVNVRGLTPAMLPWAPELVVADVSFISLVKILPAIHGVCAPGADVLVMVKPQFEVGRGDVGHGVVRDPALRRRAVQSVAIAGRSTGLSVRGVAPSPLPGPAGNVEYFLWLVAPDGLDGVSPSAFADDDIEAAIEAAIQGGPQ